MSRVVFVNRYFYPDLSATSQILTDLAFHLAERGMDVVVVTGRQQYTDAKAALLSHETVAGVDVIRVAATEFGRTRLVGRAVDYLSFYVSAFSQLVRLLRNSDIVVVKTDPPLISVICALAGRLRGARQVNWLQDLFPEVAVVLKPEIVKGPLAGVMQWARDWSLRTAQANVVLGEIMSAKVQALGVPPERIRMIHNWADDKTITPVPHEANALRKEWGLESKFVVAYSGNLGRAHDFETILAAARRLRDRTDVVFLIIGGGARLGFVREFVTQHKLTNVVEQPYQARERLRLSLGAADLHLVSLIPALEGLIVPSKFYGIAAAQRATAFIGAKTGEIATLLERHGCGRCFSVGEERALAEFIVHLAQNPLEGAQMGRNARRALEAEWSQEKAFERWRTMLAELQDRQAESAVYS